MPPPPAHTPSGAASAPAEAAPPDPAPNSAKLTRAPPQLTNPITINVPDSDGYVKMDTTKDYVVKIGHLRDCAAAGSNSTGLWLEGGRNVVLIGGRISIPCESTAYGRTGIKIRNATGTVHVEGVLIDNSGGWLTDGVAIAAPAATVQLQNLRIGPVWENTSVHPDIIQTQGGVKELRIDKLTGISTYQGIFLKNESCTSCTVGPTSIKRVNIRTRNDLGSYQPMYLFWQQTKDIPVSIEEYYLDLTNSSRSLGHSVHPSTDWVWDGDATRKATLSLDKTHAYWPSSNVAGAVKPGAPVEGDYVPEGLAGQTYVSPGY
jgi:hypothetical protein